MNVVQTKSPIIVHVNQHIIRANILKAPEEQQPPIIVRRGKKKLCNSFNLGILSEGNIVAKLVYSPCKPLDCGARLWLEAYEGVIEENCTIHF